MKTHGPTVRVHLNCYDCAHCASPSYAVQGDSGHDVHCVHPSIGNRHIADTNWDTPMWCPYLATAGKEGA